MYGNLRRDRSVMPKKHAAIVKSADFCVAGSKVRFMSPRLWYDDKKIFHGQQHPLMLQ